MELVRWKGAVVPWVAQWSGEVTGDRFNIVGNDLVSMVRYPDEQPGERFMGVLWWRQGILRNGEPQFSQLNTYRQRASLLRRRCQVCGGKLPEGPITHWLMGRGQLDSVSGDTVTTNPPTCPDCVPIATKLCPHLMSGGAELLTVREYEPWGVQGETAIYVGGKVQRQKTVRLAFGGPGLLNMVAKQLVVKLTDFDVRPHKEK